jgi:hypothetical protein
MAAAAGALRATPEGRAGEGVLAALDAGLAHRDRQIDDAEHTARLAAGAGVPVLELPALVRRRLDAAGIGELADIVRGSPLSGA